MTKVSFPGLGIGEIEIDPVAISIGDIEIRWYGLIICLGMLLAVAYVIFRGRQKSISMDDVIDIALVIIPCGIVGARLYYVAFQWDMYKDNLMEILNIRGGGLGFYGGIIGGVIGLIIGTKLRGQKILPFLDLAGAAVLIGQGIGRWGNFVNQEAFGGLVQVEGLDISSLTHSSVLSDSILEELHQKIIK